MPGRKGPPDGVVGRRQPSTIAFLPFALDPLVMTRRVAVFTGLVITLFIAACTEADEAHREPVPTLEVSTPSSGDSGSYRWAVPPQQRVPGL